MGIILLRKNDPTRSNKIVKSLSFSTTKIMLYQIFILLCCPFLGFSLPNERQEKSFSLFSVLKWQNTACQAVSDANLQGVCYTKQECDDLGGEEDGNCAAGFGTCCIVKVSGTTASPGGTVTQNCTFIENVDFPAAEANTAAYNYMVTKCSSEICQIRLDFIMGNFAQPAAVTGSCTGRDTVTVTPGGGESVPVLCGDLTGQHLYFDAGNTNAAGTVAIATTAANAAGGTKSWRIKVSQIECDSATRAPNGCLQYFLENTNTVQTFNWDGSSTRAGSDGGLLGAQDYSACIRQNSGMCSIQWAESVVTGTADAFDFNAAIAANVANAQHGVAGCAGANAAIDATVIAGMSYVQIPGASISNGFSIDTFCGSRLTNFVAGGGTGAIQSAAVIATGVPFRIRFVVHGDQTTQEAGASLVATQIPCGVNPTGHNSNA